MIYGIAVAAWAVLTALMLKQRSGRAKKSKANVAAGKPALKELELSGLLSMSGFLLIMFLVVALGVDKVIL